jgi:hypothetical protein
MKLCVARFEEQNSHIEFTSSTQTLTASPHLGATGNECAINELL